MNAMFKQCASIIDAGIFMMIYHEIVKNAWENVASITTKTNAEPFDLVCHLFIYTHTKKKFKHESK